MAESIINQSATYEKYKSGGLGSGLDFYLNPVLQPTTKTQDANNLGPGKFVSGTGTTGTGGTGGTGTPGTPGTPGTGTPGTGGTGPGEPGTGGTNPPYIIPGEGDTGGFINIGNGLTGINIPNDSPIEYQYNKPVEIIAAEKKRKNFTISMLLAILILLMAKRASD